MQISRLLTVFWFLAPTALATEWEKIDDREGIIVYQKDDDGSPVVSFRGETVIRARVADVFSVLCDSKTSHEWIPMVKEKRDVQWLDKRTRIDYTHIDMPWPMTDRYFVNVGNSRQDPDGTIKVEIKSVDHPSIADTDKIRGHLHYSLFTLKPVDSGEATHMTIELNSDPKGMIPKWLVNAAQKSWPRRFFTGMNEQLQRRGQLSETQYAQQGEIDPSL